MTRILTAAVLTVLLCALAVHAMPQEAVANSVAVQPSFDIAMPALQELADKPVIVAVKS